MAIFGIEFKNESIIEDSKQRMEHASGVSFLSVIFNFQFTRLNNLIVVRCESLLLKLIPMIMIGPLIMTWIYLIYLLGFNWSGWYLLAIIPTLIFLIQIYFNTNHFWFMIWKKGIRKYDKTISVKYIDTSETLKRVIEEWAKEK